MSQDPSPAAGQDGAPWPEDDWGTPAGRTYTTTPTEYPC
jgi:hypothetical protein